MATREQTFRTSTTGSTIPVGTQPQIAQRHVAAHWKYRVHEPRPWYHLHLVDLWTQRFLVWHFGMAFVMRRFRGMWLGWLWLPLRPLVQLLSRGLVFGAMLKVGSGDRPYLIFLLVGQAAWDFFDRSVYFSFRSLGREKALKKIDVPWISIVTGTLIPGALDAAVYGVVAIACCAYYKATQGSFYINFGPELLGLVPGIALLAALAVVVSAVAAPLVYKIPDARFLLRYLFTFLIYLTPVIYPTSSLQGYSVLAKYNPITAPIEMIKNALLSTGAPSAQSMTSTIVALIVLAPIGLFVVARSQRSAAALL